MGVRTSAFVRSLPDHRLLDRVVRGRSWIPILGVLLVGIVAMQVEILKLSANTGRSLERVTALQSRNQQLRASVAVLGDDQRVERLAFGLNMVMPGPTQVRFLDPRANAVGHALNSIHVPSATTFLAALPSTAAASAGSSATTTTAAGTSAPGTSGAPASVASTSATPASAAPASAGPAAPATATGPVTPASGTTASGTAPAVPTGASTTNTGVPSSAAAPIPAPTSSGPAVTPSTTTANGAAGVPAAG